MRIYDLELPRKLSEEEIVAKGNLLARYAIKAVDLEMDIETEKRLSKDKLAIIKDDFTAVRQQIAVLAHAVRKGVEIGPVSVSAIVAEDNSRVDVVRQDTGEVIESRALTEKDRQMQIEDVLDRIEEETKAVEVVEEPDEPEEEGNLFGEPRNDDEEPDEPTEPSEDEPGTDDRIEDPPSEGDQIGL